MNKKIALLGVLATVATAAVLLIAPATGGAYVGNGQAWQPGDNSGFSCGVIDQTGAGTVYTTISKITYGSDGSVTLICKLQNVPNSTGHAIAYAGFLCGVAGNDTTATTETISKTGNTTLVCYVPPPPV